MGTSLMERAVGVEDGRSNQGERMYVVTDEALVLHFPSHLGFMNI